MTVREICGTLEFADNTKSLIELTFGSAGIPFHPQNDLEMMAYGDFVIETCHIWEEGVNLVLKQQFVRKGDLA